MKHSHFTREIIEIVAITLLLFVVVRFIIHGYHMQSPNMQPTVSNNAYIMVNRIAYMFGKPQRGDAVVVHDPLNPQIDVMTRIIGLPGDTIKTDNLHVEVNGLPLKEIYVQKPFNPEGREWKVPNGAYFMLNDNRQIVDDSRNWGPVTDNFIVGKAVIVFWPASNWKIIDTYPAVFQSVKNNN